MAGDTITMRDEDNDVVMRTTPEEFYRKFPDEEIKFICKTVRPQIKKKFYDYLINNNIDYYDDFFCKLANCGDFRQQFFPDLKSEEDIIEKYKQSYPEILLFNKYEKK